MLLFSECKPGVASCFDFLEGFSCDRLLLFQSGSLAEESSVVQDRSGGVARRLQTRLMSFPTACSCHLYPSPRATNRPFVPDCKVWIPINTWMIQRKKKRLFYKALVNSTGLKNVLLFDLWVYECCSVEFDGISAG